MAQLQYNFSCISKQSPKTSIESNFGLFVPLMITFPFVWLTLHLHTIFTTFSFQHPCKVGSFWRWRLRFRDAICPQPHSYYYMAKSGLEPRSSDYEFNTHSLHKALGFNVVSGNWFWIWIQWVLVIKRTVAQVLCQFQLQKE